MARKTFEVDLGQRTARITPRMRFQPGDRLGTAVFVGYRKTHSQEWHDERATGYGGSDVAAICRISKYTSRYSLWAERTGKVDREDDGKNLDAKKWGTLLEQVLLAEFQRLHPGLILVYAPAGLEAMWVHRDRPWQRASTDALAYEKATGSWSIVEAKTARYEDDWKDEDGQPIVPEYYRTQDQWYLDTFGFEMSHFAVLFTGSDYKVYPVAADPFEQRVNRAQVLAFDQLVQTDTPPELDGHDATLGAVRKVNPDVDKGSEIGLGDLGDDWQAAKAAAEKADTEVKRLSAEVIARMGTAQKGFGTKGQPVVRRQSNSGKPAFLVKL